MKIEARAVGTVEGLASSRLPLFEREISFGMEVKVEKEAMFEMEVQVGTRVL